MPVATLSSKSAPPWSEFQREYGNRGDRKLSRLKYLVENSGIKWFRNAVETRLGRKLEEVREVRFETVSDPLGWHEQGDGKLFRGVHVAQAASRTTTMSATGPPSVTSGRSTTCR